MSFGHKSAKHRSLGWIWRTHKAAISGQLDRVNASLDGAETRMQNMDCTHAIWNLTRAGRELGRVYENLKAAGNDPISNDSFKTVAQRMETVMQHVTSHCVHASRCGGR